MMMYLIVTKTRSWRNEA